MGSFFSKTDISTLALSSVLGALADAAASGAVTTVDTAMQYIKQMLNELLGTDGGWTNLSGAAIASLDEAIQALAKVIGHEAANTFSTSVAGASQTTLEAALDAMANLVEAAVREPPTAKSLHDILHKDGNYTFENTSDSLEAIADAIAALASPLVATSIGVAQIAATTIDLNQGAASYDLFTGTTQAVILESLNIKMPTGAAGGSLTSISIQTDDATPGVIIDSTNGAVANLTSEAELSWTGSMYITVGTKIRLTIAGGAHGSTYTCQVVAKCRAVVAGGNLA